MNTKAFTNIITGVLVIASVNAATGAHASHPRNVVAVYSQADTSFSETITLYSDGKYQQSETQREANTAPRPSLHTLLFPEPTLPVSLREPKRNGTWRVLDKANGSLISLRAGGGLPPNAVVELQGAMPFGLTWDNRLPFSLRGDRTLPSSSFQVMPPKDQAH